jgi:hypothetical protein
MSPEHQDPIWLVQMVNEFPWKRIFRRFTLRLLHPCGEHMGVGDVLLSYPNHLNCFTIGTSPMGSKRCVQQGGLTPQAIDFHG